MTKEIPQPKRELRPPGTMSSVVIDDLAKMHGGQGALASGLEVSQPVISYLITGNKEPWGEIFDEIAEELGITPEELRSLGEVSVNEAMKIVLENLPQDNKE